MAPHFINLTDKKIDEKIIWIESFYRRLRNEENPNHLDQALYNMLDEELKE